MRFTVLASVYGVKAWWMPTEPFGSFVPRIADCDWTESGDIDEIAEAMSCGRWAIRGGRMLKTFGELAESHTAGDVYLVERPRDDEMTACA